MEKKYMVARGKSISTRVGIVSEYQEITPKKVGGQTIFEKLIEAGSIVPAGPVPEKTMTLDLRREPRRQKPARGILREPASARPVSVEVIEPEVVEAGEPEMPDKPKQGRQRKKRLFGGDDDEPAEAESEPAAEDNE